MKIAIIGAGLAGMTAAWHLQAASITLFDPLGIGGSTSRLATLLNPYQGTSQKLTAKSLSAYQKSKTLIETISSFTGRNFILTEGHYRFAESLSPLFSEHPRASTPFKCPYEAVFLKMVLGIDTPAYLKAMGEVLQKRGLSFVEKKVTLPELSSFDRIIIASPSFLKAQGYPLSFLKGQKLSMNQRAPVFPFSFGSSFYALFTPQELILAGTYERDDYSYDPDYFEVERQLIKPLHRLGILLPEGEQRIQVGLRAYVPSKLPFIERLREKVYAISGFGSKGLLYHALYGELLAQELKLPHLDI